MLEFLIDNLIVVVGGQVFQQSVINSMGTNGASLLVDRFIFIHMRWNSFKIFYMRRKKPLSVVFNSTFHYIDDVLCINSNQSHLYIESIYSNEFEIKGTRECSISAFYLDILLKLDTNGKLTIQL
jgi:hypothetical protein